MLERGSTNTSEDCRVPWQSLLVWRQRYAHGAGVHQETSQCFSCWLGCLQQEDPWRWRLNRPCGFSLTGSRQYENALHFSTPDVQWLLDAISHWSEQILSIRVGKTVHGNNSTSQNCWDVGGGWMVNNGLFTEVGIGLKEACRKGEQVSTAFILAQCLSRKMDIEKYWQKRPFFSSIKCIKLYSCRSPSFKAICLLREWKYLLLFPMPRCSPWFPKLHLSTWCNKLHGM